MKQQKLVDAGADVTDPSNLTRAARRRVMGLQALLWVVALFAAFTGIFSSGHAQQCTYTNPIFAEGQDPKLAFKDGYYYYVKWSHSGNINHIYRTRDLENLGPLKVLPAGIPLNAPIYIGTLNGHTVNKWYLFGTGVWECNGDPYTGTWTLKHSDIFNRSQYRLDYYAFFYKGELFLAWAGNETPNQTSWWFESIFISRVNYNGTSFSLVTPDASTANMVATYSFGPSGRPQFHTSDVVVEAPAVYTPSQFGVTGREDELFMTVSIDGAHTSFYSVGIISFTGTTAAEVTSPAKWQKVTEGGNERLFASHNPNQSPTALAAKGLKGPGVVALAPHPNGQGLWMYYHSKHNDNFNRQSTTTYDWIRRVMLQEIAWKTNSGRLLPNFLAYPIVGTNETGVISCGTNANTAPTISAITNRTILVNTSTGPIAFTIGDAQTAVTNLTLTRLSSNPALVPTNNIIFGGSASNRTVTVTPAASQLGSATITITVSDGSLMTGSSFVLTVTSGALPLLYNFDGGTLQGWSVVSTDAQGRQFFAIVPQGTNSPNLVPQSGSNFIGLHIPAFTLTAPVYTQDSAHNTLWLRSPEFTLNGAGDLTAWLAGGNGYGADATGKLVANVPTNSFDGPSAPLFPSFLGIALRNANTGVFALAGRKVNNGNEWEQVTFTQAQLTALDQSAVYTLDLLDVRNGGWGWVNLDSVTIPGTLVPGAPPTLSIQVWTGNQVRIAWPVEAAGYTLQRSTAPDQGYAGSGLPVTVEGAENVAYDTPTNSARFYRLMK